ncbi:MAG: hypothetical protein EP340_08730 [Alphaproteobacteria bacterium]|nr:MAG: hypothetical protein EP340_08730 [Alphaproteobacteria bacterium]
MSNALSYLHFGFAALWLGCVLTEAVFERALLSGDRLAHKTLAELHVRVDKFIELPAIAVVSATGLLMLLGGHVGGGAFYIMIAAGAVAIFANLYCVFLVFRRRDAAQSDNWPEFDRLDHQQHKFGGVVLGFMLVAIVAGML